MSLKTLLLLSLLASCDGRCNADDAANDAVPGAICAASARTSFAICIKGDSVFTCHLDGGAFSVATCAHFGTLKGAE